jgi:glycosyltransferase involved in cell wall biosynthesis
VYIVYDHQIFGWQKYGGVSRYFVEVAKRIQALDKYQVEILSPLFVNEYLEEDRTLQVRGRYVHPFSRTTRIIQRINTSLVRRTLNRRPPDIVHETYYLEQKLASPATKIVITVHDMTHEKFPQFFRSADKTSQAKRAAVDRADHVICVSENTKSDLIELFGVQPGKITVTHLAALPMERRQSANPSLWTKPYIVFVGLRSTYKNFSGLVRAFAQSDVLRNEFSIVCFGGEPFRSTEREESARLGIQPGRIVEARGGDELLADLYRNATALVYPSLYEGFGLPALEAMSAGCPVVCSRTGSLPEVCGDAAEYFDPHAPESIAVAIERVVMSPGRRQELITRGLQRSGEFSWDRCAAKTAAVYDRLA